MPRTTTAKVLAIDPGGTTGWVLVSITADVDRQGRPAPGKRPKAHLLRWGTFDSLIEEDQVAAMMYPEADYVVAESYVIRPDTFGANVGSDLTATKVLGRIEYYCYLYKKGLRFPALQTPAQAKQQWPNNRLKAHFPTTKMFPAGRPNAGSGQRPALCRHECDALRHALVYIENTLGFELVLEEAVTV